MLITITVISTAKSIEAASFRELQMLSSENASDIKQVMKAAKTVSDRLSHYITNSVGQKNIIPAQTPPAAEAENAVSENGQASAQVDADDGQQEETANAAENETDDTQPTVLDECHACVI